MTISPHFLSSPAMEAFLSTSAMSHAKALVQGAQGIVKAARQSIKGMGQGAFDGAREGVLQRAARSIVALRLHASPLQQTGASSATRSAARWASCARSSRAPMWTS